MFRKSRMAVLAVLMTFALSGFALAQYRDHDGDGDDDDYYRGQRGNPGQARQYGYQNGYRDGYRHGQEEGREHDYGDYRSDDWRNASRGYQNWMGPFGQFRDGYRNGYQSGFDAGYRSTSYQGGWGNWGGWGRGDGDHDRDDGYYGNRASYGYGNGARVAQQWGYRDGSQVAREDRQNGKRFNSEPRSKYEDRDRGYRREFGDKRYYKEQYSAAYRQGYENTWYSSQGWWGRR